MKRRIYAMICAILLGLGAFSCSEVNSNTSPVVLIGTATQEVQLIDLTNPLNCPESLGEILLRAFIKNPQSGVDIRFLDIVLRSYRVSYRRTDGGTLVPSPYVRTISGLVPVSGEALSFNDFIVFEPGAVTQAPFAALFPQNGGIDPETGRRFVTFDVLLDIFGETISGENVSTRVRFPLTFCVDCGGCS